MYCRKLMLLACCMTCTVPFVPSTSWCETEQKKGTTEMQIITVTANKIEEDIQDVPQSITVIDEVVLDEKGIKEIPDMVGEIPNMNISSGVHGTAVSFRGLNPSMFTNNNPVVLYIDGVPTTDRYSYSASFANVERVEVLRGPQGTLYGKDSIGGVINIVTKKPTNEWQGKVGAEYGSYNYMHGIFNTSGRVLEDTLFLGLNGQFERDDGWINNTHAGMDENANEFKDQRINSYLLYTPTEKFSARLSLAKDHTEGYWTDGYALPSGADISDFSRDDAEEVDYDVPTGLERDTFSQSLHLSYAFNPVTLTSTTTHKNVDLDGDYDADYGNNSLYAGLQQFNYNELEAYTQEFRLSGNNITGMRWVGGVYFEAEEREQGPYGMQFPNFDPMTYTYLGTFMMNAESVTDSTTYAAFGQVMIPFFKDQFELTLGGRYQRIDKEIDLETYFLPIDQSGPPMYSLSGEKDWNVFLPKFAFTYRLNDNWNTYASYSEGYMPGGFNYFSTSGTVDDNSFEPQHSKNYEIGVKGTTGRLRVAAALFYMDIEDIHVYKSLGTGIYYTDNAESAHSQGIELEFAYRLIDGFEFTGALGIIDAEYDTYDAGNGISFAGEKIQNTPSYTATVGLSYIHPGGFYTRADVRAIGDVYFYDDANTSFVKEDSYVTLDAKLGYQYKEWDFYVYGKNLTDEEYITDFISNTSLALADFGDPLTVGVGVRYRF